MFRSGWWFRWMRSAVRARIISSLPMRKIPGEKKEICEAQEKVFRYDHGVLEACGLTEGEELNFLEFAQKVQKKVIDTGLREKICGDCEWNEICSEKSSRWENKNILR